MSAVSNSSALSPIESVVRLGEQIKQTANGLLSAAIYSQLYELARSTRAKTIVEIGTAHGAATIAFALGAKESGIRSHVYTVDPFGGFSSRTKFGSVEDNLKIVEGVFARFGVAGDVTVVVGTSKDLIDRLPNSTIDLLLIDADGRIDRDLALLFDRLADHAAIVIDDVDGAVRLTRFDNRVYCDQKHRLTRLVVDRLIAAGYLIEERIVESTGFYTKGTGSAAAIEAHALPAYRELVFSNIDHIAEPKRPKGFRPWVKDVLPFAVPIYRRIKGIRP
jgi:predicted O-methyltransferase YrrM